jgi:pimeloyl-ACP methyl ester carboxylesterase
MTTALQGTEHYVYRRDGRVYVYRVGGGEPAILLHAVGSSGETWSPVLDQLARHLTCYNIDLPGHDHSDIPLRQYSVDDYATALVDVMDALGLEQTNLIGDHTGALLSVVLAGKYPERVKSVVLDGLPAWDPKKGKAIWEKFFLARFTDTTSYHLSVDPLITWEDARAKDPKVERAVWERANQIHRRSRLWERMTHEKTTSYDAVSAAARVKRPTLLLYGDGDPLLRGAATANEQIKGSVLKVIPETPGTVHTVRPDLFVQEAVAFIQQ